MANGKKTKGADPALTGAAGYAKGEALQQWAEEWRLDGDLCRCKHCNRGQHVSKASDEFQHAPYCHNSELTTNPWGSLEGILSHPSKD